MEWRWGSPPEKHKDTPNPHPPELEMSVGVCCQSGLSHTVGVIPVIIPTTCCTDLEGQWVMEEGERKGPRETRTKSECETKGKEERERQRD